MPENTMWFRNNRFGVIFNYKDSTPAKHRVQFGLSRVQSGFDDGDSSLLLEKAWDKDIVEQHGENGFSWANHHLSLESAVMGSESIDVICYDMQHGEQVEAMRFHVKWRGVSHEPLSLDASDGSVAVSRVRLLGVSAQKQIARVGGANQT